MTDRRKRHQVVAGLIYRGSRVLLCHRSSQRLWYPDAWDLPGGHVRPAESAPEALVRELNEELGIRIQSPAASPLAVLRGRDFQLSVWVVGIWSGEPINVDPSEHDALAWVALDEVRQLQLAHPGYLDVIERGLHG